MSVSLDEVQQFIDTLDEKFHWHIRRIRCGYTARRALLAAAPIELRTVEETTGIIHIGDIELIIDNGLSPCAFHVEMEVR
jgi:hypothetical protein